MTLTATPIIASQLSAVLAGTAVSPNPAIAPGIFGIGTWQPVEFGTIYATGFPIAGQNGPLHPYGGIYGGVYGFVLDTTIRRPQQMSLTPAPSVGLDTTGRAVVRGYPQMTWTWNTVRPDYWYYYQYIYKQSQYAPPGFKGLVLLCYPDTSSNTAQLILGQMDPPTHSLRDVGSYQGMTIHFSYLGQAVLAPGLLVQILS